MPHAAGPQAERVDEARGGTGPLPRVPALRLKYIHGEVYFGTEVQEGYIPLYPEEIVLGIAFIECPECEGLKVFHITMEDWQTCNYCKGSGEIPVNC